MYKRRLRRPRHFRRCVRQRTDQDRRNAHPRDAVVRITLTLQAYDTFGHAADTGALKEIIQA